ncbi:hypothetical protein KSP40_PGU016235 [Platanthera guangdongensis]|uniref:PCI domain-containing protein n=1 Tax=Platanthera guangdongensis TaxID=2320717 RepID=A0ABR2LEX3_9ASPA
MGGGVDYWIALDAVSVRETKQSWTAGNLSWMGEMSEITQGEMIGKYCGGLAESHPIPREEETAWNVYGVLNYLQALVEKSMIIQILEREKEGLEQFTATDGYDYEGGSNVLKMLGYYSMIGLLRVHCLLGDYHTGLKCLAPIDINEQGVYTIVIGSQISTIYHYGFANLMLRRYVEAIREFNKILLSILKYKQFHQKSPQYDQILKKNEQMYAMLAICVSLCPQTKLIDENVGAQLKEKYNDKMVKMQRFDDEAYAIYDELFSYACPKFITASAPVLEEPLTNYNQDAYRLQLKLFLYEVKQQQLLASVRSFLKLYSKITVAKLSTYMEVDEATLRTILMTYKHKMHAVNSDGKIINNSDVDFYIIDDVVHVIETKTPKRYGDYFLSQILKLESSRGWFFNPWWGWKYLDSRWEGSELIRSGQGGTGGLWSPPGRICEASTRLDNS